MTPDQGEYGKNLSLLKKNHPHVFRAVEAFRRKASFKGELVHSGNGKLNLKYPKPSGEPILIHNQDDPGGESKDFLNMIGGEKASGVVLMFGMGLGYSVLEIIGQCRDLHHLIIFELNVEFLSYAFSMRDFSSLLSDARVSFCVEDPENIIPVLSPANKAFLVEDIHNLRLNSCFQINPSYEGLSDKVFDYINAYNMEGTTKKSYGSDFYENRLAHLTSMHHDHLFEELKDRYKGKPALIVAAGPSLDKNIDKIRNAVGRAVIICVDTALGYLLKKGITPDFVTSIDYSDITYEKISHVASQDACRSVSLICSSYVGVAVAKSFPAKRIFWVFAENFIEQWVNQSLGGSMAVGGAGTVAHLNFISATIMGCGPIIFAGQDLAYSESSSHSSNVVLTNSNPFETGLEEAVWVRGVNAEKVPTTRNMHGYRVIFEKWIEQSRVKVINATEGGAWIEGADHMPLEKAIDTFCPTAVDKAVRLKDGITDPTGPMEKTFNYLGTLNKNLSSALKMSRELRQDLTRFRKKKQAQKLADLPFKTQKKVHKLDQLNQAVDGDKHWALFDEITMNDLQQSERDQLEITRLEGRPEKYLKWLELSLGRIEMINRVRAENLSGFLEQLGSLIRYYKDEIKALSAMDKKEICVADVQTLCRAYYETGNYRLLEAVLERFRKQHGKALPWVDFYSGVVALKRFDFKRSEKLFSQVLKADPSFEQKIMNERFALAEFYYNRSLTRMPGEPFGFDSIAGIENQVGNHLRLKGLKCFPEHEALKEGFSALAENDLKRVTSHFQGEISERVEEILDKWVRRIETEPSIRACLSRRVMSQFFRFHGKFLIDGNEPLKAMDTYLKAVGVLPDRPELYISLTDACFAMEDFDAGLLYLKKAVSMDRQYAVYWRNIGNNLYDRGDFHGALLAFQEYRLAMPDDPGCLKQIGDCHTRLGQTDEARKAYDGLKPGSL